MEMREKEETVYQAIFKASDKGGEGLKLSEIAKLIALSEKELISILRVLEMESRIYQREENLYFTY